MRRRQFITLLGAAAVVWPRATRAHDWREELIALAEALQHAPIGHQSE
jgi:hypothetical protein